MLCETTKFKIQTGCSGEKPLVVSHRLAAGFIFGDSTMKAISLANGMTAYVDDDDFALISKYKWVACNQHGCWYAVTHPRPCKEHKSITMHRLVMNAQKGQQIDHKDRNGLNNCKNNLRFCNHQQNQFNQRKQKRITSSRYKGVHKSKTKGKWIASIGLNVNRHKKIKYLGTYNDEIDAAKAYNNAALCYFGEFACINEDI